VKDTMFLVKQLDFSLV